MVILQRLRVVLSRHGLTFTAAINRPWITGLLGVPTSIPRLDKAKFARASGSYEVASETAMVTVEFLRDSHTARLWLE